MAVYTRRVQTVLTEDQYETLSRLALEAGEPVSVLIREAIEAVYKKPADLERRRAALESLLSLDAPVADWEQMEEEMVRNLPLEIRQEVRDFIEFLLEKRVRKPQAELSLDWRGALRDLRDHNGPPLHFIEPA